MSKHTRKDLANDFAITIQFTNKGNTRTDMMLTTNTDEAPNITNMRLHGMGLAENSTQLGDKDHEALQAFCRAYLESSGYVVR